MERIDTINVNGKAIGRGQPCFIAAEIGINHNGNMSLARRMIDAAADAGADGVKFQNYHTEDFLSDNSLNYEYISQGKTVVESQFEMFKRCELSSSQLRELAAHCKERNVVFFSTPTSENGIRELQDIGTSLLKNGSDYLVHLPLIRAMARTGVPTVISTGMATLGEIEDAVSAFYSAGGKELLILHCTSSYPTPDTDVNLRKIPTLIEKFQCAVGFSDHTDGITAAQGAVALGACFVEKHFTLDKNLPGPDHQFSADEKEFAALAKGIRQTEAALGQCDIGPTPSEAKGRLAFRLSCVAIGPLKSGYRLDARDIAFRRPGTGMPPKAVDRILGRTLLHDVPMGHVFTNDDLS